MDDVDSVDANRSTESTSSTIRQAPLTTHRIGAIVVA